jgi:hypothetical protein
MKYLSVIMTVTALSSTLCNAAIFDAEYRKQLKELVSKYDWAAKEKERIIKLADKVAASSDEDLWLSIPPQSVPRALYVNRKWGCPKCGKAIFKTGYYPWIKCHGEWKVQCPICKDKYPTNDFYKYYLSGIDETGTFNRAKADKSLLFNEKHPDPKDPLHKFGVDDGIGYIVDKNQHYRFIAHYNLFSNWYSGGKGDFHYQIDNILDKAQALGYAYAFTGNPLYAKKAGIILDRFADLYPDYDMNYWTRRGKNFWAYSNSQGKTGDDTWSSVNSIKVPIIYGLIYDGLKNNPDFYNFLSKQAKKYKLKNPKGTFKDFCANVENNIFAHGLECFKKRIVVGNRGFLSRAVILMALTAHDSKIRHDLIDFIISPEIPDKSKKNAFKYPHIMGMDIFGEFTSLTRDGFSWEGGFGYISILPKSLVSNYPALRNLADEIKDPEFKKAFDKALKLLRDRLIRFYYNACQVVCLGRYTPNFGDSGAFGATLIPYGATQADLAAAFNCIPDPLIGQLYLSMLGKGQKQTVSGSQLLDPFFNYRKFSSQLAELTAGKDRYRYSQSSENMTGRGFVFMRSGSPGHRRCLAMYYGDPGGHSQSDLCNINLYGYDTDLTPGLAYPDMSKKAMRFWWHDNTISHNTVFVDLERQKQNNTHHTHDSIYIGDQKLFAESPLASIVEVEGKKAYPQLDTYRRTCALVNIDENDFYVVDFFAVQGGKDHILSFHGSAGEAVCEGKKLSKQSQGTYAGENIPYDSKEGRGLQYLFDVRKGTLEEQLSVEWKLKNFRNLVKYGDAVRLRATALSYEPQEIALAEGQAPQNIPKNPKSVTYMLRRKRGKDLSTLFISVYESYLEGKRRIKNIRLIPRKKGNAFSAALEINFLDGSKDIIVKCAEENDSAAFDNDIYLKGKMAVARYTSSGKLKTRMIAQASELSLPGASGWKGTASLQARVSGCSTEIKRPASITIDKLLEAPKNIVYPLWTDIYTNVPQCDCNYKILSFKPAGSQTILNVDTASFIAYKNYSIPTFKNKKINWRAVIRTLNGHDPEISVLRKLLPAKFTEKLGKNLPLKAEEAEAAFSSLLKSGKLASNPVLTKKAAGYFAEKARERGITNLGEKDLALYNYLILRALLPKEIPVYPNFIYEFEKGAECVIPFCYYYPE